MPTLDPKSLASELHAAYSTGGGVAAPPSSRDAAFDLATAYAVQAELVALRRAAGHVPVGRKVGYANKAMWRVLELDTLVWAHMYDDTVRYAPEGHASISLRNRCAPKIEPEIVFKLSKPLRAGEADPAAILDAVEWTALGFEIIDCVFPDWQFQPVDFVAAFGLHAALIVGEPHPIEPEMPGIVEQLARFKVRLLKNDQLADEGSGKNALRSPALSLGELAAAIAKQPGAEPLAAGEIISTGTLTTSQPIAAGETWRAEVAGLNVSPLSLRVEG